MPFWAREKISRISRNSLSIFHPPNDSRITPIALIQVYDITFGIKRALAPVRGVYFVLIFAFLCFAWRMVVLWPHFHAYFFFVHTFELLDWFIGAARCWATLWNRMRWCRLSVFDKHVSVGAGGSFDDDNRGWPVGELFLRCISIRVVARFVAYVDTGEVSLFNTTLFMEHQRIFVQVII